MPVAVKLTGYTSCILAPFHFFPVNPEPLAKLNKTTTPVTYGVQKILKNLDSGLRRNDVEGLLQEALLSSRGRAASFMTGVQPAAPLRAHTSLSGLSAEC